MTALAYPPPTKDVTAEVTWHRVKTVSEYDALKGTTEEYTDLHVVIEATAYGRSHRFRAENGYHGKRMTLWHDHGRGSSSGSGMDGDTIEDIVALVRRHAAAAEDPCGGPYGQAWTLGTDLDAKVHALAWGTTSSCGRDLSAGTRVLRTSVADDQWCKSCYERSW